MCGIIIYKRLKGKSVQHDIQTHEHMYNNTVVMRKE